MVEKHLEKFVGTPADVLDRTVNISQGLVRQTKVEESVKKARKFWHSLGPGLTTGASDDDPSGIGTYSQAGAVYGFQLLWLAAFTFPFMAIVQEMCARIGLVTGRGLAGNIRIHFPKWVLYITTALLVAANTFNIGRIWGQWQKRHNSYFPILVL
jgi:Mn2+/Fe2+ NRAMP family transporter